MVNCQNRTASELDLGELKILGKMPIVMYGERIDGDLKLTWRKDNAEEVALAEKTFKEYINKGWFAISEVSGKKKQIFTFNPDFEKIILVPIIVGG